jgi:hypothetical protein
MSLYSAQTKDSIKVRPDRPEESGSEIDAEVWVLETEPGQQLLADVAEVGRPRPVDIARWRKQASSSAVAAAIRLSTTRRKAQAKFSRGARMWLDPVGLEQSTCELVARHKAARFQSSLVVDLCAGIGGDTLALAQQGDVLAVDLDCGRCRRLAWNARTYGVEDRVLPCRSRAETLAIPPGAWVHIDPDRRTSGPDRARCLADYQPGPEFLKTLIGQAPGGAIKLGPASDFAAFFSEPEVEVELISLNGECKEAAVWYGSAVTCRRRATRLPENVTWTDRHGSVPARVQIPVLPVSIWVYDPDPALIRAGLLDSFAAAHGLGRIAGDVDYLTGDRFVATPFLAAFQVRSIHSLDLRRLKRMVAEQALGPLEIKLRGLDLKPETIRAQLRPRDSRPATLILAGGSGPARAILAQRISGVGPLPR